MFHETSCPYASYLHLLLHGTSHHGAAVRPSPTTTAVPPRPPSAPEPSGTAVEERRAAVGRETQDPPLARIEIQPGRLAEPNEGN